jgi:hypothetical protein
MNEAFHRAAVIELARVASEVRIFPLLALDAHTSPHVERIMYAMRHLGYEVIIERVNYE